MSSTLSQLQSPSDKSLSIDEIILQAKEVEEELKITGGSEEKENNNIDEINSTTSSSTSTPTAGNLSNSTTNNAGVLRKSNNNNNNNMKKKGVSFAAGVSNSGTYVDIGDRTHEQLQIDLKQAELDLNAEKILRRKKERSLIKLAKELSSRRDEIDKSNNKEKKLLNNITSLEAKIDILKVELSQRIIDYNNIRNELNDLQNKYNTSIDNHKKQIQIISTKLKNEQQNKNNNNNNNNIDNNINNNSPTKTTCTATSTNRTIPYDEDDNKNDNSASDNTTKEINKNQQQEEEEDKSLSTTRTLPPKTTTTTTETTNNSSYTNILKTILTLFILPILLTGIIIISGNQINLLLSIDSLCSPVKPGSEFTTTTSSTTSSGIITSEAPWWVPSTTTISSIPIIGDIVVNNNKYINTNTLKADVFNLICSVERSRTLLEYNNENNKLSISKIHINGEIIESNIISKRLYGNNNNNEVITIYGNQIIFTKNNKNNDKKKQQQEIIKSPWSL